MDPLSAASSIIAVLQLTGTVVKYLNGVKNASSAIKALLLEVSTVQGILTSIKDIGNEAKQTWISNDLIPDLIKLLKGLEKKLAPVQQATGLRRAKNKLAWPFKEGDFKVTLASVERLKLFFRLALQTDHFKDTQLGIERLQINTQDIRSRQIDMERRDILKWLSSYDVSANHNAACNKHEPTTRSWFFQLEEFKSWKGGSGGMIWIHGIPGCGKSILCSTVIEDVKQLCQAEESKTFTYFYFDFTNPKMGIVTNFLRSIIAQLAGRKKVLPESVRNLYHEYIQSRQGPDKGTLVTIVASIIESFESCYIILDALDECGSVENRKYVLDVLRTVLMMKAAEKHVHMLATSQKELDIQKDLEPVVSAQILMDAAKVDEDIRLHIHKQLDENDRLKRHPNSIKKEIIRSLVQKAHGMSVDQLKKVLKKTPETLSDTYDRILENISEDDVDLAHAAFQWLAVSQRPLYLDEVAEAAVLEPRKELDKEKRLQLPEDILEICSSLVTNVTTTIGGRKRVKIRFAHSSVEEYLVSNMIEQRPSGKFFITEFDAQESIATHCLSYIQMLHHLKSISEETTKEFPLLRYAAKYWPDHVLRVRSIGRLSSELETLVFEILAPQESTYFRHWLCVYDPDYPWRDEELETNLGKVPSSLYYGASFGMVEVVSFLLEKGVDANAPGGQYGSALQVAAWMGHKEIVRVLLKHGAKVDAQGGHQGCAVHMAAAKGNLQIVKLLLEYGADAHFPSGHYGSALHAAAENGQFEVVQLNKLGQTPLWLAAYNGYANVVRLLLEEKDVEPDSRNDSGHSPLWWAAQNGHEEVVKMLLDRKVQPDCKDPVGRTPLSFAAQNGHKEVVRLLLDQDGIDLNFGDECNITPLTRAAQNGHTVIVKVLLESGANPDPQRHTLIEILGVYVSAQVESKVEPSEDPPPCAENETVHHPLENDMSEKNKTWNEPSSLTALTLDKDLQLRWDGKRQDGCSSGVIVAKARAHSLIVVTGWIWDDVVHIRLYYLNAHNYLQEHAYTSSTGRTPGALNALNTKVSPFSQIAVTSWGDRNIYVFYQDDDLTIRELCGLVDRGGHSHWRPGSRIVIVAPGSFMGVVSWKRSTRTNLRLYYESENYTLRERCWDGPWDSNAGYYKLNITPEAPIAAIAWGSLGLEGSGYGGFYMRIYTIDESGNVVEILWRYGWVRPRIIAASIPNSKLAVVQRGCSDADLEIRVYCASQDNILNELGYSGEEWKTRVVTEIDFVL
ncbi:MAG: hypothetical protein M1834_009146 [Cirrosporium novae-zelandiae]|nr:MAG: hypothetical protein M1834_009146 [Cirrosporium novae-zelandiae]